MGYRVVYEFNPFDLTGVDKPTKTKDRKEVLENIAEYVRDEILQYVGDAESPVAGRGKFKELTPAYKKVKAEISNSTEPNLELYGDMLDALEYEIQGNKIKIGWWSDPDEAAKADGHNNHSGKSSLPIRRAIPTKKETFKKDIIQGMKEIAESMIDED
jgi:hypothetical protein